MTTPLDDLYLEWLCGQLTSVRTKDPDKTYWQLIRQLYSKEFVWLVPNDDNRVEDGRDLRIEFITSLRVEHVDSEWIGLGCSVLELLVGISRRLTFEAEGTVKRWFWELISNLNIEYNDTTYNRMGFLRTYDNVDAVLERFIWRTYRKNGSGGLFPLNKPESDQTQVEIWYQLSAYLLERF